MTDRLFLRQILEQFDLSVAAIDVEPFGEGLINSTFKVSDADGVPMYVLQRINHLVFRDVEVLQNNIYRVTEHIRQKLLLTGVTDVDRRVLNLVPTTVGRLYHFDGESYWRVYHFIRGSKSLSMLTPESAYLSGQMFGNFQCMLSDLPEGSVKESIPGFHNMPLRLSQFNQALAEDRAGRVREVSDIIDELKRRGDAYCVQEELYAKGELPKRINHCDTKLNNILFDENDTPLCVVDLDTVMPGFVLSDFGDFVRISGNMGAEDEPDLSKIALNKNIVLAYAEGYLSKAVSFLTEREVRMLAYGPALMTYMQAVRFFTDYLNGDIYYKIAHEHHNLQRTRAQFRFLQILESEQQGLGEELLRLTQVKS